MRLVILFLLLTSSIAMAQEGLVIHASEFIVSKFHRYDNQVHPYSLTDAWIPYILPTDATTDKPIIQQNADGSFTVFFSTLEDLMQSVIQITQTQGKPVSVLNVHAHGLPGAMWFPQDNATLASLDCEQYQQGVQDTDQDEYLQYYTPVTVDEIMEVRQSANDPSTTYTCMTGLPEWTAEIAAIPQFKSVFAQDAQIHFLACVNGLGALGQEYTLGVAKLVLPEGSGHLEASMDFGLGDWSITQGMGFWDYQSDAQVNQDEQLDSKDHKDAEIAQQGTILLATFSNGGWSTGLTAPLNVMTFSFDNLQPVSEIREQISPKKSTLATVRIPGTTVRVSRQSHMPFSN